jgi:YidC/Oxa1 family membrane protein insertase
MREGPNVFLRILVPVLLLLGGVGMFFVLLRSSTGPATTPGAQTTSAPAAQASAPAPAPTAATAPAAAAADPAATASGAAASQAPAPSAEPAMTAAPGTTYVARTFPLEPYASIGSLEPASTKPGEPGGQYQLRLEFDRFGAGIRRLALANHFTTIRKGTHEPLQELLNTPTDPTLGLAAFAADEVVINGVRVGLGLAQDRATQTLWRQTAPGAFEAVIADQDGKDVARVTRVYQLPINSYGFTIRQSLENLTDAPMSVVWKQFGPADQPLGTIRYGGDVRRARFGYLRPASQDPTQQFVQGGDRYLLSHHDVLGKARPNAFWGNTGLPVFDPRTLWPNDTSRKNGDTLAWAAMTSRYFAVAMFNPEPVSEPGEKAFALAESVGRVALPTNPLDTSKYASASRAPTGYAALTLTSRPLTVAPGASVDLSVGAYAGPLSKRFINADPPAAAAGLATAVIYTFGGPCGFCTFQSIAIFLRNFLGFLHDRVVFDWALAIMILVVCVRTILHPVTRWSQMSLARFGKQMANVGPKMKAVQDKYKDDPAKLREEVGRLMREENVNYAGMLGCLPALLQTPIWIALYAMIYFTFELRHEGAFFGAIQHATGGAWSFLGDLAEPDNFLNFHHVFGTSPHGFWVWGLSSLMGPIEGLNVLPLVLGVVFFIQQKYMTPASSMPLTDEQKQQQAIMKVMTVVMFPIFMYNAPAALSVYFLTNSSLAIIESKWIRKRFDELEKIRESQPKTARKAPKPGSWLEKIQNQVLEAQRRMEEQQRQAQKKSRK